MSAKRKSVLPRKSRNTKAAAKPNRKKNATSRAARPRPPARPGRGNMWVLFLVTLVGVTAAALEFPTFIIFACGVPPALVSALVDDQPGRHASMCVLAASLAGMIPVLISLWSGGNTIVTAMMLMSDVYVWLGMYGAAAVGWMLIWLFPMIAEVVLQVLAVQRIGKLRRFQDCLVAEWSETVTGASPGA